MRHDFKALTESCKKKKMDCPDTTNIWTIGPDLSSGLKLNSGLSFNSIPVWSWYHYNSPPKRIVGLHHDSSTLLSFSPGLIRCHLPLHRAHQLWFTRAGKDWKSDQNIKPLKPSVKHYTLIRTITELKILIASRRISMPLLCCFITSSSTGSYMLIQLACLVMCCQRDFSEAESEPQASDLQFSNTDIVFLKTSLLNSHN